MSEEIDPETNDYYINKSANLFSKSFIAQTMNGKNLIATHKNENHLKRNEKGQDGKKPLPKWDETMYSLRVGEYLDEKIKILKFWYNSNTASFFLCLIEPINTKIIVKSLIISEEKIKNNETKTLISSWFTNIEICQNWFHENILNYFELETWYTAPTTYSVNIWMEYNESWKTLYEYWKEHNQYRSRWVGLPWTKIKLIMKGILQGLNYLHENNIIHSEWNPSNILVNDDLSVVKIMNYSMRTHFVDIHKKPKYSCPWSAFHKSETFDSDIWSVGCILFELVCGYKPYHYTSNFNTLCILAQYISPIEESNDDWKDLLYSKVNRPALDFMYRCFRTNEGTRPTAEELLQHKLLN